MDAQELAQLEALCMELEAGHIESDPGDAYDDYHPEEDALEREEWNSDWYASRGV